MISIEEYNLPQHQPEPNICLECYLTSDQIHLLDLSVGVATMPVEHIVCMKFKDGITQEQIDHLHQQLLRLKQIKGIQDLRAGKNFTTRADFHYVLVVGVIIMLLI